VAVAARLACVAGLVQAVFGGVLFHDRQFAFRDAAAFYYPLHLRVQQEWEAGRWPLWAPEANSGSPLLGNPVAAVLYPGKAVFFLFSYAWAARVYIILHAALAFGSMWALLRGWQVSPTGRLLGALAYGFGAPVLTQTGNVIYLVGAAWAPLGLLAADSLVRLRRRGAVPALALVLALEVLGGDPEAAYVTVAAAAAYSVLLAATCSPPALGRLLRWLALGLVLGASGFLVLTWWSARVVLAGTLAAPGTPRPWRPPQGLLSAALWGLIATVFCRWLRRTHDTRGLGRMLGGLFGASLLALALSGAQLVPVLEFTRLSFRAAEGEGFHNVYPFSVSPFQLVEAVWPNVYGTTDRGNHSWFGTLPPKHEDNLWMPSIYVGGLTLVLASAGAGFRGGPPGRAWLTGLTVVSVLAALGAYASPLLWARCVPGWGSVLGALEPPGATPVRTDGFLADGDGGIYWLLASVLPAFPMFRYPAKFLVFTALGVSGLAGMGWDRLGAGRTRSARVVAGGLLVASMAALAATLLGHRQLLSWFAGRVGSTLPNYGPLDSAGAIADLQIALGQGVLGYGVSLSLTVLAPRRPGLAGAAAALVLMLDLAAANTRHVVTVPQSAFEGTPRVWKAIEEAEKADPAPGPFRVQRLSIWWPRQWSEEGSIGRTEEITRWERGTLRPLYPLPLGISSTFFYDTTELRDYGSLLLPWPMPIDRPTAGALGLKPGDKVWYYPRRAYDLWNTRYFILPGTMVWDVLERGYATFLPQTTGIYPPQRAFDGPEGKSRLEVFDRSDDVRVVRNNAALPRAWIVHDARVFPPLSHSRPSDRDAIIDQMLYPNDSFWHAPGRPVIDFRALAWVETDRPKALAPFLSRARPDPAETVAITRADPQRIELRAVLRSPGLVVLAEVYYPGWVLTVDGRPAEILRTNRAMRGAALPAGTHQLVFGYQPLSFRVGLGISLLGLTVLAALGVWAFVLPRGSMRQTE
jgi:hypothetical protein